MYDLKVGARVNREGTFVTTLFRYVFQELKKQDTQRKCFKHNKLKYQLCVLTEALTLGFLHL